LNLNGTVVSVDASAAGDRVYAAGYFTKAGTKPTPNAAVISSRSGAAVSSWQFVSSNADEPGFQFAIREIGSRFYVGGSQHSLFGYDRTTLKRVSGVIATRGGDFQTMTEWKGLLYAGCHCDDWSFSRAYTFIKKTYRPGPGWSRADKISFVGAWRASTGAMIPDFNPVLKGRMGYGAWASFVDSNDNLWVGGDFRRTVTRTGPTWVGGFARFPVRDTVAPSVPTAFTHGPIANGSLTLSWAASQDASPLTYEVLRGDRVVATTGGTSLTVPAPTSTVRYFVRAVDREGNRSASTPVLRVVLTAPTTPVVSAAATSPTSITVAWNSQPNVAKYLVSRNGTLVGESVGPSFVDPTVAPATTYTYSVVAVALNGSQSAPGAAAPVTTPPPAPLPAPTVIPTATATPPSVTLSWAPVAGASSYRVTRDSVILSEGAQTSFTDPGVVAGATYIYSVVALGSGVTSPAWTQAVTVPLAAPSPASSGSGAQVAPLAVPLDSPSAAASASDG
jgi:chitodextrinase